MFSYLPARPALFAALVTALPLLFATAFTACSSTPAAPEIDYCGSPDPCGCESNVGQVCTAQGTTCTCTSTGEAGAPDASDAATDAPSPPPTDLAEFVGTWSPVSGTGEANCGGQVTPLPPNPNAVLTFTKTGPTSLSAASSGAGSCVLELVVSGATASLAQATESCAVATGGSVSFTTFTLVYSAAGEGPEGGISHGAVDMNDAGADATPSDDAGGSDDVGTADGGSDDAGSEDGGPAVQDAGVDGGSPSADAGVDGGSASADAAVDGASPLGVDAGDAGAPQSTLDWQLADTDGVCVTTLHYTLVRTP
jgi:hypothetical protein